MTNRRKSGGKRAAEAKRKALSAARSRGSTSKKAILEARAAFPAPPKDARHAPGWILQAQLLLAREALTDPGPAIEATREQASRILAAAAKSVDAAKLRAELDDLLERLTEGTDGPTQHGGEDRPGEEKAGPPPH